MVESITSSISSSLGANVNPFLYNNDNNNQNQNRTHSKEGGAEEEIPDLNSFEQSNQTSHRPRPFCQSIPKPPPVFAFVAKILNSRHIATVLKAVHFKDLATCFMTKNGLKICVEDAKSVQASAFINRDLFESYELNDLSKSTSNSNTEREEADQEGRGGDRDNNNNIALQFGINISVLLECLNIFGAESHTTGCKIVFGGPHFDASAFETVNPSFVVRSAGVRKGGGGGNHNNNHNQNNITGAMDADFDEYGNFDAAYISEKYTNNLVVTLDDNGVITECTLRTLDLDPQLSVVFNQEPRSRVSKIIMSADHLYKGIQELDIANCMFLEILISPDSPFFRLSTFSGLDSSGASVHVDYPRHSDVVEQFVCEQTCVHRYKTHLILPSLRALQVSSKVNIRVNGEGVLSLQYMIDMSQSSSSRGRVPAAESQVSFVEFNIVPSLVDEDY
eukprot:Nk52_evm1s2319 gene=Nk52_evmTU1s2319